MSAALIHIADPSVPGGWRPATAADFAGAAPGGGSGDASAANQATQITRETEIRDRLPAALVSGALPVVARGGLTALGFEQITSLSSSAAAASCAPRRSFTSARKRSAPSPAGCVVVGMSRE